ncbi:deoxyribonuclease, partial [Micrococcus luteus]|nr:deoxyribonuclease [Micrococcus luteus]
MSYRASDVLAADSAAEPRRAATEEKSGRRRRLEYPPAPEPLPVPVVDN